MKRILFIGLGSIGKRHLLNLSEIFDKYRTSATFDALRSQNNPLPKNLGSRLNRVFTSPDQIKNQYDYAFICTPTHLHFETIRTVVPFSQNLFIEKPVFDRTDYDLDELGSLSNGIQYVACPLRYTSVLQSIKKIVSTQKVLAVRAICSTYLPNWHSGTDYRNTYSAHRKQGGGVSIDLIHEWDYISWLFGYPLKVSNMHGKFSNLEIDSDDHSLYIARYPDKQISLSLDYFGRIERREVELYLEEDVIVGDIRNQKIHFLKENKTISCSEERDAYQKRELCHFLSITDQTLPNDNSISHALHTLMLAKGNIPLL